MFHIFINVVDSVLFAMLALIHSHTHPLLATLCVAYGSVAWWKGRKSEGNRLRYRNSERTFKGWQTPYCTYNTRRDMDTNTQECHIERIMECWMCMRKLENYQKLWTRKRKQCSPDGLCWNCNFSGNFRSFSYSFSSSEAGRKTVSDDHFVGSDKIMRKTTAEYVCTENTVHWWMAGGFLWCGWYLI